MSVAEVNVVVPGNMNVGNIPAHLIQERVAENSRRTSSGGVQDLHTLKVGSALKLPSSPDPHCSRRLENID